MNLTTTQTTFEVITGDTVKYSSIEDLAVKTQEEKIQLTKAVDAQSKAFVDSTMTSRILDIADEVEAQHGPEKSNKYLSKTKGIVTDSRGKIERRVSLLVTTAVIDVEDDARVTELENQLAEKTKEVNANYTDAVAKQAILDNDLKRANEVIKKLQSGDDVTVALNEAAKLREQLTDAQREASKVQTITNDLSASQEALANAKTQANNLKRQIVQEQDKLADARSELTRNTGEALLDYEHKKNADALIAVEVAKKVRMDYPLRTFLVQNGMAEDEIRSAESDISRTEYGTNDVEAIASIIHNQRNTVDDSVIVDKIEALIAGAMNTIGHADNAHTYNTLKNTWHMQVQAMTSNALAK